MTPTSQEFVDSVLALRPRNAVFDCDGTLWDADSGMEFFYWIIERGMIEKKTADWAVPRYADYKAGKVEEETMCGEMVQICKGLTVAAVKDEARVFFREKIEPRIFLGMLRLTNALRDQGCMLWAVSSSNQWLIEVEAEPFGFVPERVLAAAVELEQGAVTDRLVCVPTGPKKATSLRRKLNAPIDAVFGNSIHDLAMLELAKRPFVVHPNPDLAIEARKRGWPIYEPEVRRAGS
jgi:phosphoserine phosphatase